MSTASGAPLLRNGGFPTRCPSLPVAEVLFRFRRVVLTRVLICAIPVAGLLAAGNAEWGGKLFWVLFALVVGPLFVSGTPDELLCVLLSLAPFMNLLRGFALYNIVDLVFLAGLVSYYKRSPGRILALRPQFPLVVCLAGFVCAYYAFSLVFTHDYSANLRFFELLFSTVCVLIVGRSAARTGTILTGILICSGAIGLAMLPHLQSSGRLGEVVIGDIGLGNPVQLGLPLALAVLALTVDQGRWIRLRRRWARLLAILVTFSLLALTTSRASWLVVAVGALVILLFGRRQRLRTLVSVAGGALLIQLILMSRSGEGLQKGIDRTFSRERSVASVTSGRSDQWIVAYDAWSDSLGSLLFGHGPGLGPQTYARFSMEVPGVQYAVGEEAALHSLYMQVAVETGLLGLTPLLIGVLVALLKIVQWTLRHRLLLPLTCFIGYVLIAMTVSGNDTVSGVFLGIGLLVTLRPTPERGWHRTRELDSLRASAGFQPMVLSAAPDLEEKKQGPVNLPLSALEWSSTSGPRGRRPELP